MFPIQGLTLTGNKRAHDLVDLQLIMANGNVDIALVHALCCKLFKYRKVHEWPPKVVKGDAWEDIYYAQSRGINVLPNVDAAVDWANELIARIANSELPER